ncbi:MAG: hypothetical protein V4760_11370 [Bdellovibrionota bacterium]
MKSQRTSLLETGTRLDHLEELVDELIKSKPEPQLVKSHMKAAGLAYSADPIDCMNKVLAALDAARSSKGKDHEQEI